MADEKPIECDDCGEPATLTFEDADDASGYRGARALCQSCLDRRLQPCPCVERER